MITVYIGVKKLSWTNECRSVTINRAPFTRLAAASVANECH